MIKEESAILFTNFWLTEAINKTINNKTCVFDIWFSTVYVPKLEKE